jgi:RNA polymerase sigma factor (sigma-70 family)
MDPELDEVDWHRVLAGDGEAFGRVFDRHRFRVRRHAHRLLSVASDAEDVVALVFFEAWRRRDAVHFVDGSLLPWLLVTATNSARNLERSVRRHRALLAKLPPLTDEPDFVGAIDDGPATAAMLRLGAADQRIITLCILEGLDEREAAEALGVPTGTVKSRLSRARRRLAQLHFAEHPSSALLEGGTT